MFEVFVRLDRQQRELHRRRQHHGVTYGVQGSSGVTVCKRDANNQIVFQGDWCTATQSAATSTCADAVQLTGTFEAGSVKINN